MQSGVIHVEGLYPDDRPVKNARISVKDSNGVELIKGRADEKGRFSFPIPKIDTLKITVGDMLGHRTTVKLRQSVIEAEQN
ncbi:MAG: carboxypeptidase regulatory-like domain-containing protein [Desulfuromonadales bacterium]|nr:carboxypeptidase regulatory-like domain-containing protein [Desulfuromonadales bacterium]